jgi:hypothetical protein
VISFVLNIAVALTFGYLSFWGLKTGEVDTTRALTVAAKLARWQNCVDRAGHPVRTSFFDDAMSTLLISETASSRLGLVCSVHISESSHRLHVFRYSD